MIPFEPYFDRDGITIYNADCRQVLPFLGTFDLLLTDPPYGVLPVHWDKYTEEGFNTFLFQWLGCSVPLCKRAFVFSPASRGNVESCLRLTFKNVRRLI